MPNDIEMKFYPIAAVSIMSMSRLTTEEKEDDEQQHEEDDEQEEEEEQQQWKNSKREKEKGELLVPHFFPPFLMGQNVK